MTPAVPFRALLYGKLRCVIVSVDGPRAHGYSPEYGPGLQSWALADVSVSLDPIVWEARYTWDWVPEHAGGHRLMASIGDRLANRENERKGNDR